MNDAARERSPYLRPLVVVALLVPLTFVVHALIMIFGGPSIRTACVRLVAVAASSSASTLAPMSAETCERDLDLFERAVGRQTLLVRLRNANFRRCVSRIGTTEELGTCIERWNDGWGGQLLRLP